MVRKKRRTEDGGQKTERKNKSSPDSHRDFDRYDGRVRSQKAESGNGNQAEGLKRLQPQINADETKSQKSGGGDAKREEWKSPEGDGQAICPFFGRGRGQERVLPR